MHLASIASSEPLASTNAPLSGRVTDSFNARIVGAKVTAITADTNFRYEPATKVQSHAYTGITVDRLQDFRCKIN